MSTAIDLSCPNGCFEAEVSGGHATRDDEEFLREVAVPRETRDCPICGERVKERDQDD